jgi:hypothetical protein
LKHFKETMNMTHMRPFGTMNSQYANFEKNTKTGERKSHQKKKKKWFEIPNIF